MPWKRWRIFGTLRDIALLLGLSATRVAVAFLLVPLFTNELMPPLVRNAMFVAIALLSLVLQPAPAPLVLSTWQWLALFAKEAFIGGAIGFLFGRRDVGLRGRRRADRHQGRHHAGPGAGSDVGPAASRSTARCSAAWRASCSWPAAASW